MQILEMHARGLLLVSTFMKDPVITKVLVRCREQAVAPSLTGGTCSCGGKMSDMEEVVFFLWPGEMSHAQPGRAPLTPACTTGYCCPHLAILLLRSQPWHNTEPKLELCQLEGCWSNPPWAKTSLWSLVKARGGLAPSKGVLHIAHHSRGSSGTSQLWLVRVNSETLCRTRMH